MINSFFNYICFSSSASFVSVSLPICPFIVFLIIKGAEAFAGIYSRSCIYETDGEPTQFSFSCSATSASNISRANLFLWRPKMGLRTIRHLRNLWLCLVVPQSRYTMRMPTRKLRFKRLTRVLTARCPDFNLIRSKGIIYLRFVLLSGVRWQ